MNLHHGTFDEEPNEVSLLSGKQNVKDVISSSRFTPPSREVLAALEDKRLGAEAVLYGINLEIAQAQGDAAMSDMWMRAMYSATRARNALRDSGCYFMTQGDTDRLKVG